MKATKTELRSRLKQERLGLSGEERQANSAIINERLVGLIDWSAVKSLHYFEPLMSLGEVDISRFIAALGKRHPAIELFTTRKFDDLWHVVPIDGDAAVDVPAFDAIIVPMLGFDPHTLHRIGYGGGYYDKLLAAQPQARKIGVCFELGKVESLPAGDHDIVLDTIVTERATYNP